MGPTCMYTTGDKISAELHRGECSTYLLYANPQAMYAIKYATPGHSTPSFSSLAQ